MSNLLALLKRIEFIDMRDDCGLINKQCVECGESCTHYEHHAEGCELKAQIDRLEAEEKVLSPMEKYNLEFAPGRMRCQHSKIPWLEGPLIDVCEKCSVSFDISGMEPPTSERNEGHA